MAIKQLVLGLTLTLISLSATAGSDESFTWPVIGKPAGSDMLYTPGSYIEGEKNHTNLFIGTTEGDQINDSVAYLGLATFDLDQMTVERIRRFVDSIKPYLNLIVDLLNNSGGSKDVSEEIFSFFARDTLRLEGFNRVYKTGSFPTFNAILISCFPCTALSYQSR